MSWPPSAPNCVDGAVWRLEPAQALPASASLPHSLRSSTMRRSRAQSRLHQVRPVVARWIAILFAAARQRLRAYIGDNRSTDFGILGMLLGFWANPKSSEMPYRQVSGYTAHVLKTSLSS